MRKLQLHTIRYWLFVGLVFSMPMSLLPSVSLPLFDFPSFRVGLYQLLAVSFVGLCLPLLLRSCRELSRNKLFLTGLILLIASLSIGFVTTLVPGRTILYSMSLLFLLLLGLSGYVVWMSLKKDQKQRLPRVLMWSGITFGGLAIIQLLVASFDKTALGTLCLGCTDAVFGFPRINLFAAEPQFFANSLIPALFSGLFFRKNSKLAFASIFMSALAIGLTFSRGAFLAISVAFTVYLFLCLVKRHATKRLFIFAAITGTGIFTAFGLLVVSATIRYRETPFITYNTVVSMIDHMSLGTINIPQKSIPQPPQETVVVESTANFTPEGFVAASSNDRLNAADLALDAWDTSLGTQSFGVGMGNLGAYVNQHVTPAPSNLTVYIWYVLVLAEIGAIGLFVLLLTPGIVLWRSAGNLSVAHNAFIFTVLIAFLVQLITFGTYINIMYLYLFVGVSAAITKPPQALRPR